MVNNSYYKCNFCGCTLRFRYQVGFFDIPVSVYCPECNCHIHGLIDLGNDPQDIKEHMIGASEIKNKEADYIVELSTEFITNKCKRSSEGDDPQFSMFLRSHPLDKERTERRARLLQLVGETYFYINTIENLYNLLENERIDLIRRYFLESENDIVKSFKEHVDYSKVVNKLDASLAIKHFVNSLLQPVMPEGAFNNIYTIMNEKVRQIIQKRPHAFKEFLIMQLDNEDFEAYLYRLPKFIVDYLKCVGQLIPIYDNYSNFDSLDLNISGISTMSIDDLVVIYKKGYELLCDSIDLVVALNNIYSHGTYDNFGYGKIDFNKKLNGYSSKFIKYEEVTNNDSIIFDGLRNKLNNIIRNAEGHNSIRINGLKQEIVFTNKHKGSTNTYTTSFLEFGKTCVDLFVAILYIWEYYYQTLKFKITLVDGVRLNYGK